MRRASYSFRNLVKKFRSFYKSGRVSTSRGTYFGRKSRRYSWKFMPPSPPSPPNCRPRAQCFPIFGPLQKDLARKRFAADTWHPPPLSRDKRLGATMEHMLICQWWILGALVCTICYYCAMYTLKSGVYHLLPLCHVCTKIKVFFLASYCWIPFLKVNKQTV